MLYQFATENQLPEIANIMWQYSKSENHDIDQNSYLNQCGNVLRSGLENKRRYYLVAMDEEKIIGKIFVQVIEMLPNGSKLERRFGYLSNLYVLPEYRNQGVGEELLSKIVDYSKENKFERLITWPSTKIDFYLDKGFKINGEVLELNFNYNP